MSKMTKLVSEPPTNRSSALHLVIQRVPLRWWTDAEEPEDSDVDNSNRSSNRVEPD